MNNEPVVSMQEMSFKLTKNQAKHIVGIYLLASSLMLADGLLNIFGRYDDKKVEQHQSKIIASVKKITNS